MIVDDETSVLKGLRHIFTKHCPEHEIVGTAQSAKEALDLFHDTAVDVVITDIMMPDMNGIELSREIRRLYPHIYIVILSGHAEFEFVREAMRCGAFDYLLKPCRYQTVIEVFLKIQAKAAEKEKEQYLLSHKRLLENLIQRNAECPVAWAVDSDFHVAVFSGEEPIDPKMEELLVHQLQQGELERMALETVVFEGRFIVLFREAIEYTLLKERLNECRLRMRKQNRILYASVHRFRLNSQSVAQAFEACRSIIEYIEFNEYGTVMDNEAYTEHLKLQESFAIKSYFCGNKFGTYYIGADAKRLRHYIETSLQQLHRLQLKPSPAQLKRDMLSELIYLEHMLKEQGAPSFIGRHIDYVQELNRLRTFKEVLGWLKHYVMSAVMCMNDENQNPHYIQAAVRYMERNYMKDLTLKEVANAVYLNAWYFSSQFKKYTNYSFSEFLNQIRIRIAKEFLRQKDLKVYQVAEMAGFQDASYFSTVFKHLEGITPKEYQQAFQATSQFQ
ncbi:response regulator [Paenibacillus artemisiicola]|uniref:response regulator n=1 Tax=Paenibacillus artemisiicola TaxID=1172618 RepID=UPI0030B8C982